MGFTAYARHESFEKKTSYGIRAKLSDRLVGARFRRCSTWVDLPMTILGHKSVETTKKLVDGDPVNLASIVAGAV